MVDEVLETRRGSYRLEQFDLWKRRADIAPAGDVLHPGKTILIWGSCFAEYAADYLCRRDYDARIHPAGELYNTASLRSELEHLIDGTDWSEPIAVPWPSEVAHRIRKRCRAKSVQELIALDKQISERARGDLNDADVLILLVGTTCELWRDSGSGEPFNEIPPPSLVERRRGPTLDYGNIESLREDIGTIQQLVVDNIDVDLVLAVCPIPLYATWSREPVLTANGRSKASLRAAIDAELLPSVSYLDLWDWTLAQAAGRTPMQADGRHFSRRGTDRIMHHSEQRLGGERNVPPLSKTHTVVSAWQDLRHGGAGRLRRAARWLSRRTVRLGSMAPLRRLFARAHGATRISATSRNGGKSQAGAQDLAPKEPPESD